MNQKKFISLHSRLKNELNINQKPHIMYAIVDIAGQQFKVSKAGKVFVHRLQAEEGSQIELNKVLLLDDGKDVKVGQPQVEGATVLAEVVEHMKGDKVLVFHKKRRKSYQKMNGHRQYLTRLNILSIQKDGVSLTGENAVSVKKVEKVAPVKASKAAKVAIEEEVKAEPKKATRKAAAPKAEAKTTKPAAKKAAAPKAEKKPAAKKTKKDE